MAYVIVCDDDPIFGKMVSDFLSNLGHESSLAVDVSQLKVLIEKRLPDLVVVDMQMQGGGGPAAGRLLPNTIPVIVASGMPKDQQERWFAGRANIRFLEKPVELPALERFLGELLKR